MSTVKLPFTENPYKIPGYTGYITGLQETYKKTPVQAQDETLHPLPESFIHTRTQVEPQSTFISVTRDPCNNPENFRKPQPGNLWPNLQEQAVQPSCKAPISNLCFGDDRVDPFTTSYNVDFKAPLRGHDMLRSPNRNEELVKTTTHNSSALVDIYKSAYNRVGDKRLQKMISTMRERMEAKLGNSNNNAFRTRRLFLMYDHDKSGRVHFEDFRNMCETFGMQLDDDCLMALFFVYDPQGSGFLVYEELVSQLLGSSDFCFYKGYVDNSQAAEESKLRNGVLSQLAKKVIPVLDDLRRVLKAFDSDKTGFIGKRDLLAGCAALSVVLSSQELETLMPLLSTNPQGQLNTESFLGLFSSAL